MLTKHTFGHRAPPVGQFMNTFSSSLLGEHMNTVTRTISNPPSASATPVGTPSINMRKLAHLNSANNNNNNNIGSPNTAKKGNLIAVAALRASQQGGLFFSTLASFHPTLVEYS